MRLRLRRKQMIRSMTISMPNSESVCLSLEHLIARLAQLLAQLPDHSLSLVTDFPSTQPAAGCPPLNVCRDDLRPCRVMHHFVSSIRYQSNVMWLFQPLELQDFTTYLGGLTAAERGL